MQGSSFFGSAKPPWSYYKTMEKKGASKMYSDDVVLNVDTLSGYKDINDWNDWNHGEGKTLVHEAGHYIGLLHTWGVSCCCFSF